MKITVDKDEKETCLKAGNLYIFKSGHYKGCVFSVDGEEVYVIDPDVGFIVRHNWTDDEIDGTKYSTFKGKVVLEN